MAPAMPRNAPLTPIPVIASMITWEPERIQRRLQSFSGLSRGKTRGASWDFGGGIKYENTASGMHERAERLLVQGTSHGDRGDMRAFVRQFRAGV